MDIVDVLSVLFRWLHVVAGILWIGLLYWFNFVNIPFGATMDGDTKKKVIPELIPRALWSFRYGALYTYGLGLLLLMIVFYHGGLMFDQGVGGWGLPAYVMLAVTLLSFGWYDPIAKSGLGKDLRMMGIVGIIIVVGVTYLLMDWAQFSYRAYNIHIGAMFGTIMAANVWMRIWPCQKKVLDAMKAGTAPDPALVALVGQRSRHNTYLSVPLVWTMINAHTVVPGANSPLWLFGATIFGWFIVWRLYTLTSKVKGW
ncbi:MAG TPA: urate hydroxylase PuuD [Bacteroidota bacterium]|nr:urate hydroxylase PuuD [Bacteroidota bacterium]